MNNAENESQQLHIYRALTSIFQEKGVLQELLKFGVVDAVLRGMKKFSRKTVQTSALQLLQLVVSSEEGRATAEKSNVRETVLECCQAHSGDAVVEHLVNNVVTTL